MLFNQVRIGDRMPKEIAVIIEIPAGSAPVKYEVNKQTGVLTVDRFMPTPMFYPVNYGYLPDTLGLDGDPLDAMVVTPYPLLSGSVIQCRPLGLLNMTDESGEDSKILAVPVDKLTLLYQSYQCSEDLPMTLRASIVHFFEHYKDLEPGKWVKVEGWSSLADAERVIIESVRRAQA